MNALGRRIYHTSCFAGIVSIRVLATLVTCALTFQAGAQISAKPFLGPAPTAPPFTAGSAKQPARATENEVVTPALTVDNSSRAETRAFYQSVYSASEGIPIDWTGSLTGVPAQSASGIPGTTSPSFKQAVALRINWFRAMAGVPAAISLNDTYCAKDQQMALMISANNAWSHFPPTSWLLYTNDGAEAASHSNVWLGLYGPSAITAYITDYGLGGNASVGHRRWLLYPQTQEMGTGDVPPGSGFSSANAVWVVDSHFWDARPSTRNPYVAWPPPGYVPYQVVFPRWSFSYPGADFTSATVAMTGPSGSVPVAVEPVYTGYGDNTLVWRWNNLDGASTASADRPAGDASYNVMITNAIIAGVAQNFSYTVTIFDPASLPPTPGPSTGLLNNISTRLPVGTGDNVLIAGFVVGGSGSKELLIRALGPTLSQFGVSNVLQNPTLELRDSTRRLIDSNDDWAAGTNSQNIPAGLRPPNSLESAILATLDPGAYTAIVSGLNQTTGVALAEVYDVATGTSSHLTNISTRGFVQAGDNVMIAGIIVQTGNENVLVRALGPTLATFGVANVLANPTLELHNADGALGASNDNWKSSQQTEIQATGYAPPDDAEAAILTTLPPGNYTAIVSGLSNTTGNALVEVYVLP